jgi:hypothetical protein
MKQTRLTRWTARKEDVSIKLNGVFRKTVLDIHNFVHERYWEQFHTPKDLVTP